MTNALNWDVVPLSESVKIHSSAARVLSLSENLATSRCMDHAILHGKPLITYVHVAMSI